jgi:hypothetical protein
MPPSKTFPIYYSPTVFPFDTIQYEILIKVKGKVILVRAVETLRVARG